MLRSISLTRRSYSISNSFRKCYRLRITVRLNHNQARRPPSSPEITEGLFLHEAYNPLWSNSAPLTEATSFDDFGTSALDVSNSSDLPLHQYLDNLLRPYPVTIETTAELGGRAELNDSERDSLETAIAEGYDVSAVLGDLYSSSIEQDPAATEELSIKPGFGLEHKPISAAANTENSIIPAIQPIIVAPQIPSTSYDIPSINEEKEEVFVPPHEQLLEAFENQDINSLKQVLKANPWPSSYDLGPHVNEILRFVVERSATSTEALQLLQNFIKQNPKYYLRDDLFIPLGIREIEENGVESAAEILKKAKALSYVKTNSRTRGLHKEQYRQLFDSATRKEKLAGAVHIFKTLSQLNMLNAQRDVRQWIEVVLTTECLEENVHTWKTISVLAGTTEGVDLLWDKLLLTPDGHRYIGSIMRHCQNLEHSLGTLSELICALVKNRLNEEAHMVFSKVYLMGRHLRRPLKRFLAARDLTSIEMLADLVTNCLFAEKRNRRPVKEDEKASQKSELSEALVKAVDAFSGKQPKILATKAKKEHKPKRHKINEEQLFAIATEIRDAWSKLATDEASKKKLTAWCNRNDTMLRFNRVTSTAVNLRIRFLQQLASRSAGTSAATATPEGQPVEKFIPSVEQLHSKYKEELQNNKLSNIFEVIERIEWGGDSISGKVWQRASTLLTDSHTNVAALTDRQLAQVIYAFGDRCDGVPKQKRRDHLENVLKAIEQQGVKLGPMSRTAVFAAKVDNDKNPSVVEELQAWEAAGLTPSYEILQQFARAYALEGNVQGVIDIMTHMKTSQMPVDENVAGALIYSMVLKGQLPQAEAVAKKFSATLNEIALETAIIDGLIKEGELDEAVNKTTKLASSAKIHQSGENTRHLLRVICNLIENGVHDAFHKLSAYLSTSANGSTLSERANNGYVFVRARGARSEGKLAAALEIYSIVHPSTRSENFEQRARDSFLEYLRAGKHDIAEIINILDKLSGTTNIRSPNSYLLQAALGTPNWQRVFENLKKDLPEVLVAKPELKRELSKAIIPELSSSEVTDERRAQILADLATILFTKTEGDDEIEDISKVIYVAAGRDVPHVISALKILTEDRIKREMATSVIQQILEGKGDALKMEKLEKLLSSEVVESINATRIQAQLKQRLKAKAEPSHHHIQLLAKLIALAYSAGHQRMTENYASKVLISILSDTNISTSRLNKLVEHLENEPKVRLSRDEVLEAKNKMAELKLEDRVEFLDKLKAQGQTYSRWMASSVASLEDELTNLEAQKANPSVIFKLQEVILKKLIQEKEIDFILCERTLRKISEYTPEENGKGLARLKKQTATLWEKAFLASLQQGRQEVAQQLWKLKTSFSPEAAISYIALQFVRGSVEHADEACAEFISSAQSVTAGSLELASKIVADYDANKVDALAKYLKDKLQLKNNMSRRIVSQIRRKQLREMLEKDLVENAFQLAVEETSATGMAFGQHELFKASFDRKDTELTEKVYKMVMNAHDKNNAILDLAFAMLEHGIMKHGENLFQTNELSISPKKLEYFVNRCVQMQRPDMLKSILFSLNNNKNVALVDLNKLLIQLIKIYYTNNSVTELQELESKLKEVSYPMDQHIQKVFENRKNESAKTQ